MLTGAARAVRTHGVKPSPAAAAAPVRKTVRRESRADGMFVLVMRVPLCLPDSRGAGDETPDYAGMPSGESACATENDGEQEADSTGRPLSAQAQGSRALLARGRGLGK